MPTEADTQKLLAEFIAKLEYLRDFYHSYTDLNDVIKKYKKRLKEVSK